MTKINICKQHDMDEAQCRKVAEQLMDQLIEKFGGSLKTRGEHYLYKHPSGIDATVQPRAGELQIDVKMGLLTRAMAPQLEAEIDRVLDEKIV